MTVIEALNIIKAELEQIPVRLCDMPTIGNPIMNAAHGIGEVIKAIEATEAEKVEAENNADDQNQ